MLNILHGFAIVHGQPLANDNLVPFGGKGAGILEIAGAMEVCRLHCSRELKYCMLEH